MSTPHPLEEQALEQPQEMVNPWQGTPQPRWYSGMGFNEDTAYLGPMFTALQGAGQGAAKGEELMAGLWHKAVWAPSQAFAGVPGLGEYLKEEELQSRAAEADARDRVKTMTPNASTVGAAGQLINGLASGLYRYTVGSLVGGPLGAAATMASTEAASRYKALQEQGLAPGAAIEAAGVTGVGAGLGALMPAGFGSSLIGKVLTGAGTNVGFGLLSRYADHGVLEAAGYPEMAAQEKPWDATAMATDALMGGGYGLIAHVHGALQERGQTKAAAAAAIRELEARLGRGSPGAQDAALTLNLALADRRSSPGVPVDPAAANAHNAAMEKALGDVAAGKPVDVSETGVDKATFTARPANDPTQVQMLFAKALEDAGFLDQRRSLESVEASLGAKLRGEAPAAPLRPEGSPSGASPESPAGPRWVGDRGAIPGEPSHFLDVKGDDLETAKAALVEHEVEGSGNATWEAMLPGGKSLGVFDTMHDAAKAAEAGVSRGTEWNIPRNANLSEGDRAIESRFADALSSDYEGMKARYAQLPDAGGGKILNTDTARELSPDYLADRTKSAAVHEPASAFVKRLYAEMLSEPPKAGEDPVVLLTAGGTGAGKSSAAKTVLGEEANRAQIVMDTNMNREGSAVQKIDQALAAGKEVKIAYVHREPVEALINGALPRAMRQESQFGSGRTVPIEEHINTHVGANDVVRKIAEHYQNEAGVSMRIIDNSRGPGGAALIDIENLPKITYNETREKATAALEAAHAEGRISPAVYRGFGGERSIGTSSTAAAAESGAGGLTAESLPASLRNRATGDSNWSTT